MKLSGWKSIVRVTLAVLVVVGLGIGVIIFGVRDYYHETFPEIYGENPTAIPVAEQRDPEELNKTTETEAQVGVQERENKMGKEGVSPISIVLPENNAEWEIGSAYRIQWMDDMNILEDGNYHLYLFNGTGEKISISVGQWGENELYYTVNNLMSTPPGTYTLKVCEHPACEEGAISQGVTVRITNESKSDSSITLITPKGEEVWKRGDTKVIQWVDTKGTEESTYAVYVTDKEGVVYGALANTAGGTSIPWFNVGTFWGGSQLPELRPGEVAYYIKVVDTLNPSNHSLINSPLAAFVLTE